MSELRPGRAARPEDWVAVGTAPDQLTAEIWRGLLETERIPSMLAPADAVSFLGLSAVPCRVLVPHSLVDSARRALEAQLSAEGILEREQDA
jgi:hypothetical protein